MVKLHFFTHIFYHGNSLFQTERLNLSNYLLFVCVCNTGSDCFVSESEQICQLRIDAMNIHKNNNIGLLYLLNTSFDQKDFVALFIETIKQDPLPRVRQYHHYRGPSHISVLLIFIHQ